jgi:hypothetical protein
MEFAKNVLISVACLKALGFIQVMFLRSDLSCHHFFINLRNR